MVVLRPIDSESGPADGNSLPGFGVRLQTRLKQLSSGSDSDLNPLRLNAMNPDVVRFSRILSVLALLASASSAAAQDTRTVSGTVVDSGGRFIPYASIDGGPRVRTVSNGSGEFTL